MVDGVHAFCCFGDGVNIADIRDDTIAREGFGFVEVNEG